MRQNAAPSVIGKKNKNYNNYLFKNQLQCIIKDGAIVCKIAHSTIKVLKILENTFLSVAYNGAADIAHSNDSFEKIYLHKTV